LGSKVISGSDMMDSSPLEGLMPEYARPMPAGADSFRPE
jgi:hypothetical protein